LVVDIFIAETKGVDALGEKVALLMGDVSLVAEIADTKVNASGKP